MSGAFPALLPVHGFVLAGGKSSRMGRDKASLEFRGRSLVLSAVEMLRGFCETVSIAGNRDDLRCLAPVVKDARREVGPAAGMEAGLKACAAPWALFVPVDVPLVPESLLRPWAEAVLGREGSGVRLSTLRAGGQRQPTFCMLHRACAAPLAKALEDGERKLGVVFDRIAAELGPGSMWVLDAESIAANGLDLAACFTNVNTPEDLAALIHGEQKMPQAK